MSQSTGAASRPLLSDQQSAQDLSGRDWARILKVYSGGDDRRALLEVALTAAPLAGFWALMLAALNVGVWLSLLLAIPAGGFMVRLFIIQHDCGHGSFFSSTRANDWVGRIIGVLTLTPYGFWRHHHALHHASSGNLDKRGFGDVLTLTVEEYEARSPWGRFCYRFYRHPLVMFGIGPAFLFLLQHRVPVGLMRNGWAPWISTLGANIAIAALAFFIVVSFGWKALIFVHLPIILVAAAIGVWLFFVQHQFEETNWENAENWTRHDLALSGSSHYDLPAPIHWITGNIGVHHVHHLCSNIPFYRLQKILKDHPALRSMSRLTVRDSLKCVRLALWDEGRRRMVAFRDLKTA